MKGNNNDDDDDFEFHIFLNDEYRRASFFWWLKIIEQMNNKYVTKSTILDLNNTYKWSLYRSKTNFGITTN